MRLEIPIKVEVKGRASSSYDSEMINRRLRLLTAKPATADSEKEVVYLEGLLSKINEA